MKRLLFCLPVVFASFIVHAQIVTDTVHRLFKGELDGDAIRKEFGATGNRPWDRQKGKYIYEPWLYCFIPNSLTVTKQFSFEKIKEVAIDLKEDSAFIKNNREKAVAAFDSGAVIFTAYGISRKNAAQYEFSVLKNKVQEVLPWSSIKLFCESYVGYTGPGDKDEDEIAYLGEFKTTFGTNLKVQLRKRGAAEIISTMTVFWVNRKPEVLGVFTYNELPDFLSVFKREAQYEVAPQTTPEERATKDSLLVLKKSFASNQNSLLFYLDDKVRSKGMVEYKVQGLQNVQDWKGNEFDVNIIWLRDLPPGKYRLFIRYSFQRHNVTEYEFEIKPAWQQTTAFKIIAGSLTAAFFGFVFLLFKTRRQKQRLQKEQVKRELAQTELKAVRSQLNPHFIFNALGSIQGLVNKADLEAANRYLSDFSSLMRSALKEGDNEFTALGTELNTLETYLKLEQLRFRFQYSICVENGMDANETEVPALLLQPLVENAVKHGAAFLREKGKISISIKRQDKNMIVEVADNGAGFAPEAGRNGHGLKLTKARIKLLNGLLKEQSIRMNFSEAPEGGGRVILQFNNWV